MAKFIVQWTRIKTMFKALIILMIDSKWETKSEFTYRLVLRTTTLDCRPHKVAQLYRKHHVQMHHIPEFDEVALKR